jgi:hypothetical protein
MVYQHGSGLLGNHQHLLQKACFSLLGLSQLCNQDASLFGLSFLTFGEELVLLEMLCQSLQMLLRGHQLGLYSDQIASETQGLLGQKTQQLLNLWKVLCKIF